MKLSLNFHYKIFGISTILIEFLMNFKLFFLPKIIPFYFILLILYYQALL